MQVWKVASGTTVFSSWTDIPACVAWAPDKSMLAIGRSKQSATLVEIWDIANIKLLMTYSGHTNGLYSIAWSPNGKYIASAGGDGTVQIWNSTTGRRVITHQGYYPDAVASAIAWSPDDAYIASIDNLYSIQIWDAINGNVLFVYTGHKGEVKTVSWSPDGQYIASGDSDFEVHIWQAK